MRLKIVISMLVVLASLTVSCEKKIKAGESKTFTVKGVTIAMRYIPAGSFMMGSPADEAEREDNEVQHKVTLTKGYWMMETEVTQELWQAVMGNNPSRFEGAKRPVECVSWYDAIEFCNKLSVEAGLKPIYTIDKSSKDPNNENSIDDLKYTVTADFTANGYRLPTEAEWEYASRAGTSTALYNGKLTIKGKNNGPELDEIAWYAGNSGVNYPYTDGYDSSGWSEKQYNHTKAGTREVGTKKPNAWGLYDMIGNVWEWCSDWYGDYPTGAVTDPVGSPSGSYRVDRGGGWYYYAQGCRSAYRHGSGPGSGDRDLGFRAVQE